MVKTAEKFKDPVEDEVKGIVWNISLAANGKAYWCVKKEHEENCHIFLKEFTSENRKVRDHFYYTGLYQGAAHNNFNLKYWIPYPHCVSQLKWLWCLSVYKRTKKEVQQGWHWRQCRKQREVR